MSRDRRSRPISTLCLVLLVASPIAAQHSGGAAGDSPPAPWIGGLGTHSWAISTYLPQAQRYFDQGVRLLLAFNLEEAERSFREAARQDPTCSMCYWGIAMALGPHINFAATPERTIAAFAAASEAARRAPGATPVELALIEAIGRRYGDPPPSTPEGQSALDTAYAEAMAKVAGRFPDHADVLYLAAEAQMNLHPWDLYEIDGSPKPWTPAIVGWVERGLAIAPDHPGLCHLYIHAVEASTTPERAVAAADRLHAAMPGAAHMVHMPSHIYQRVGRYADSAIANERAIASDGRYLPYAAQFQMYPMYAAHNHQFLWFAAQMEGRSAVAYAAARDAAASLPLEMLRQFPGYDGWLDYPIWTLVRFGRWAQVLLEPMPPSEFAYATAAAHIARAIAAARLGDGATAESESAEAVRLFGSIPAEATQGFNPVSLLAGVATNLAAAEIARARADWEGAVARYEQAVALEDGARYDEPSDWYFPPRHLLGPALLEAGRAAAAEAVFREDLRRNRENGWALSGLAESLRRQAKTAESEAVAARALTAWSRADLDLQSLAVPIERASVATASRP